MIRRYCILLRDDTLYATTEHPHRPAKSWANRTRASNELLIRSAGPARAVFKWARVIPCLVYADGTISVDPRELNENRSGEPRPA